MKNKKHIFFDLDHTIWDFDKNAEETLSQLYASYQLKELGFNSVDIFIETYTQNNHALWLDYHLGKISKEALRAARFKKTFVDLGISPNLIPQNFEDDYVNICPTKTNLFPGAHQTLKYLENKYELHLISNGFKESAESKLKNTSLTPYFKNVIISETVGANKPDKAIFEYALQQARGDIRESVMIGDSLVADIRGAINFGMDAIYFNPNRLEKPDDVILQIHSLAELEDIF